MNQLKLQTLQASTLMRTRFQKSIKSPNDKMLKAGRSNKKLGAFVRKGWWRGLPIFSLTLEERATCPSHCEQWANCYGNNMPFAHRFDHQNQWFEQALATNLAQLSHKHEQGFVVRLHVLGDFYSEDYVRFWLGMMSALPGLRAFGYTHHRYSSPIGQLIAQMNEQFPNRWRVRFSDDRSQEFRSEVVASEQQAGKDGIVCPEQLGLTESCGDCGYCWHSNKPVYFLEH